MKKNNARKGEFDVIIIGGGASGISSALWCDELGLSALLLEKNDELGGQLLWTFNPIKNHLGIEAETGRELRDIFLKQIEDRRFSIRFNAEIKEVDLHTKQIYLTDKSIFSAKAIIIATGIRRRKLNVEGEDKFTGKGIITSGKQSAEKVTGKNVAIVGGGDAAFENALILAENAARVTLVHRNRDFRARAEFIKEVKANSKIEILTETIVKKIEGKESVETVEIIDLLNKKSRRLPVEVLLIRIGVEPNTKLFDKTLKKDKNGYILTDSNCLTNIAGIFAVGDIANTLAPTISSAVGMGATATKTIYSWLNS